MYETKNKDVIKINKSYSKSTNYLILFTIFFLVQVMMLGTDHIKGIIVYFGFMIILIFMIFLLRLFSKK